MAHLPYVAQALLGEGPEAHGGTAPRPPRNDALSSLLEATFQLNWGYSENSPGNPVASLGCTTYMGPPVTERAGYGARWSDAVAKICYFVVERVRELGYTVDIIPEDHEEESDGDGEPSSKRQKKEVKSLRERELEYIRSDEWDRQDVTVFDVDTNLVAAFCTMSMDRPWLIVSCFNDEASDRIYQLLSKDYELAEFPHVREKLPINTELMDGPGDSYRLEAVTGAGVDSETKCSIGTHFALYFRDASAEKEVAKALCSYQNGEMDSVGPTLEMIETAEEWQRHGLSDALMRAIHKFFCDKFEHYESTVWFSVCHVTNHYAAKWYMEKHHFRDLDGMCEELGKELDPWEYEYEE